MTEDNQPYDVDFGYMQFNGVDEWDCNVAADFPHPPTCFFALHIWSDKTGPTAIQRELIQWLKSNYERLWPEIADKICRPHPDLDESGQFNEIMQEWVAVYIGEKDENSLELVYDFDVPEEESLAIFITLDESGVKNAFLAD